MGWDPSLAEVRGVWSWAGTPEKCGFFQKKQRQEPMESMRRGEDTQVVVRPLQLAEVFEGL